MFRVCSITLAISLSCGMVSGQVLADAPKNPNNPQTMRAVMQQLGKEMENITAAISVENWLQVEKSAAWIADHPKPSMAVRKRIMKLLGNEMGKFKSGDMKTHDAARELSKVAAAQDGEAVISAFATLQSTCLSCHQNYRAVVKQHLNEK